MRAHVVVLSSPVSPLLPALKMAACEQCSAEFTDQVCVKFCPSCGFERNGKTSLNKEPIFTDLTVFYGLTSGAKLFVSLKYINMTGTKRSHHITVPVTFLYGELLFLDFCNFVLSCILKLTLTLTLMHLSMLSPRGGGVDYLTGVL